MSDPTGTTPTPTPDVTERPPLRIVGLRISNYKRVVAVDMHPDGRSVVVGGRNAQGKSSLLDAIADALGGAKRGSKTDLPLRTGSVKGEVRVDLGEYVVTRTWSPSSDKLVVESPPGSPIKSPQGVLDRLVGDLSFDPLGFARHEPVKQAETLRRITGLDTRVIDERRAAAYGERTTANAALKRAKTVRDETAVPEEPPAPPPRPSVTDLLAAKGELEEIIKGNAEAESAPTSLEAALVALAREQAAGEELLARLQPRIAATESVIDHAKRAIDNLRAAEAAARTAESSAPQAGGLTPVVMGVIGKAEELLERAEGQIRQDVTARDTATTKRDERIALKATAEDELVEARQNAAGATASSDNAQRRLVEINGLLKDADAATARHDAAQRTLTEYQRARDLWRQRDADVDRHDADVRRLNGIIERCDDEKLAAIGRARFPIDGLGLDGDVVTYRGVPFAQASQAQKVLVGFAIGAALNPTLRVILIREGALLDDESLAALMAAAAERGFQIWIETVGTRDAAEGVGIIIEDGRLALTHGEPMPGAVEEG